MRPETLYHLTDGWSQNLLVLICSLYTMFTPCFPLISCYAASLLFSSHLATPVYFVLSVHWNSIFLLHERKGSLFHFLWLLPSEHTALNYQQRQNTGFHKCTWERTPSTKIRGNQIALELYELIFEIWDVAAYEFKPQDACSHLVFVIVCILIWSLGLLTKILKISSESVSPLLVLIRTKLFLLFLYGLMFEGLLFGISWVVVIWKLIYILFLRYRLIKKG